MNKPIEDLLSELSAITNLAISSIEGRRLSSLNNETKQLAYALINRKKIKVCNGYIERDYTEIDKIIDKVKNESCEVSAGRWCR